MQETLLITATVMVWILDFEWFVEGETLSIPTSGSNLFVGICEEKAGKWAGFQ